MPVMKKKKDWARVAAILQLCVAFSIIVKVLMGPFMGDYFDLKSQMLLVEAVTGDEERFSALDPNTAAMVSNEHIRLTRRLGASFGKKSKKGIQHLLFELSPFIQFYVFVSIVSGVLILKRIAGGVESAFLLTILALAFSFDNVWYAQNFMPPDHALFPTEEQLVQNYLDGEFSSGIIDQKKGLGVCLQCFFSRQVGRGFRRCLARFSCCKSD